MKRLNKKTSIPPLQIELTYEEAKVLREIHGLFSTRSLQEHLRLDGTDEKELKRVDDIHDKFFNILVDYTGDCYND